MKQLYPYMTERTKEPNHNNSYYEATTGYPPFENNNQLPGGFFDQFNHDDDEYKTDNVAPLVGVTAAEDPHNYYETRSAHRGPDARMQQLLLQD